MSSNKTEQATPTKIKKAADKGQIARSKELGAAASLLGVFAYLLSNTDTIALDIKSIFLKAFSFDKHTIGEGFTGGIDTLFAGKILLILLSQLMLIQFILIPIASVIVGGLHMKLVQIKPKLSKISPLEGVKRLFSLNTIVELIKSILKISVVFITFYFTIKASTAELIGLSRSTIELSTKAIFAHLAEYSTSLVIIIIAFAMIDGVYQKFAFAKKLRMSKQDLKDEHKEQEGRPEVKQRVKQIQTANAKRSINSTVPTADIILTNPTHYAVALKYDLSKANAPYVVAKGVDDMAFYIRSVGEKNKIPIFEHPPLARAVYNTTNNEQMIPNQLFIAMAQVLNYVKQTQEAKNNNFKLPTRPTNLPIPKEFYERTE
ncbi:EscU/YscU/HrcU family type III secretion system export apparatus switch protein [Vibrio sp. PNB22_3_1]